MPSCRRGLIPAPSSPNSFARRAPTCSATATPVHHSRSSTDDTGRPGRGRRRFVDERDPLGYGVRTAATSACSRSHVRVGACAHQRWGTQAGARRPHRTRAGSDSAPRADRSPHTAPARPSPSLPRRPSRERQTPRRSHVPRQARSRDSSRPAPQPDELEAKAEATDRS